MADGRMDYIIGIDDSELRNGAAKVNRQFDEIGSHAQQVGSEIDSAFKKAGAAIGAYFAVDQLKAFTSEVFNVRAAMQSLEISFEVLLGSQEKANALFSEMKSFAVSTPMQLGDLANAAQTMLGFGIAVEEVMPMLKSIGDISMGNAQKFQSLSLAFSQMSATGKLMGQDLLQMINAGFNPLNEISKKTGKSVAQLKDEMSKGSISAQQVADAFKSASAEGGQFAGMLEKQSKGLAGAMSNLKGAWEDALNSLGEQSEGVFVDAIELGTDVIKNFDKLAGVILTAAAAFGTYKATLMATEAYHSVMAGQAASIEAARQAELASILARQAAVAGTVSAEQAESAAKVGTKTAIDEKIASMLREMQVQLQVAEAELSAAMAEQTLAREAVMAENARVAAAEKNLLLARSSGNVEQYRAAQAELVRVKKDAEAAAELRDAAAKRVSTAETNKQNVAQKLNNIQTQVDTVNKNANTAATSLWGAATKAVTTAMHGLKAAIMSNPLGLLLTAVTTIIGLFITFKSKTEDSTKAFNDFVKSVDKATTEMNLLYALMNTSTKSTKVVEDSIEKLNDLFREYGVIGKDESLTLDELIKKHDDLAAAIKNEAIAREEANQLARSQEEYTKAMEKIKNDMEEDFKEMGEAKATGIRMVSEEIIRQYGEEIRAITEKYGPNSWMGTDRDAMLADLEKIKPHVQQFEEALKQLGLTHEEVNRVMARTINLNYAWDNQLNQEFLIVANNAVSSYTKQIGDQNDALENRNKAIEIAKGQMEQLAGAESSAEYQARLHKMSIEALHRQVELLIAKINANSNLTIKVTAQYDDKSLPPSLRAKIAGQGAADLIADAQFGYDLLEKNPKAQYFSVPDGKGGTMTLSRKQYESYNAQRLAEGSRKTTPTPKSAPTPTPKTPKKTKTTKKTTTKKDPNKEAREQERYEEKQKQARRQEERDRIDAEFKSRENEISIMEDGTEKTIAQLRLDFDKRKEEIKRGYEDLVQAKIDGARELFEANPKNKDKLFSKSEEAKTAGQLTDKEKEIWGELVDGADGRKEIKGGSELKSAKHEYEKGITEAYEAERQAMWDFLKEYGTYQEKKKAIADDYANKIAKATTQGEKLTLQQQMEEALAQVDLDELSNKINWEAVFSNLDSVSIKTLKELKQQLKDALDAKDISADNARVITERIAEIDKQLNSRRAGWRDNFGLVIPELEEQKRLIQEAADAQERLNKAQERQKQSLQAVADAQAAITKFIQAGGKTYSGEVSMGNMQDIMNLFQGDKKSLDALSGLFGKLSKATTTLTTDTKALGQAEGEAAAAGEAAGGSMAQTVAIIDAIVHKVNENVQSANELVKEMGLEDTKFGKGFSSFAESSQYATQAWESLKNGNIMGVATGVVGSLRTLGEALGAWGLGGFGSSDKNLLEDIERLTASNEALRYAVDALTEEMEKSSTAEALSTYNKITDDINQSMANTQEMMSRAAAAYNNGFLGIGGKGSSNKKIDEKVAASQWARVSQITGASVKSASDFFNLTSEQMYKVAKEAPEIYALIKTYADDGYQDAAQFMDDYIEYWKQLEEAEQSYFEKMSSTSLDSIVDDFTNALMDMDSKASDFSKNFEKYMQQAIINGMVSNKYQGLLKNWYESFAKAMEDGMTKGETEALRNSWDAIVQEGIAERNALRETFGWTDTQSQDSSKKGFATASQDSIDELNGRFTAVQMSTTHIEEMLSEHIVNMEQVRQAEAQRGNQLSEMTNLIIIANNNLETIAKNTRELYGIREDIASIKRNTDKL